ncbi:MAG: GNAT family N-acetyltransferase [Rugosibacter sp.]
MTSFILGKNLYIRRIDELTAEEVAVWDQLLLADDLRRAFMSYRYARTVAETGGDVVVLVLYDNHAPCGFLPLQRVAGLRGKVGIFEPVGGVMTDYFGLVAIDGFKLDVSKLLDATNGQVNAIFFTHLTECQKRFGLVETERRIGLRVRLNGSFSDFWDERKKVRKDFVRNTEKKEKNLASEVGPIFFEWNSSQSEKDLAWLIEAKERQYKRTGKNQAPLFDTKNIDLLNRLLQSKDANCEGMISSLRCGEKLVAAHFGLRCHDMLHVWFPVYDHDYSRFSPGRILKKYFIEYGQMNGVSIFDSSEGDSTAKREFANEEHYFYRGFWQTSGFRGIRARVAMSLFWRISSWFN